MIQLSIIFGLYIIASTVVTLYLVKEGRDERQMLENKLMALSKPDAVILHGAMEDKDPAKVDYVDEERELALTGDD